MQLQSRWPVHAEDEMTAASRVLASGKTNYWTGPDCRQFEADYAAFTGTPHAVAVMNGTVALEAALWGLGVGPGDEVITASRTFIASASAIVMRGATPVVADVDADSQNVTAETLLPCITPKTAAVIVVHLAGWPADMAGISRLARARGFRIVEDCAQAHGATLNGQQVGSLGDVAAFSFCQDKIITTGGEGGMVTTRDSAVWQRIWSFRDHGKNHEKVHAAGPPGFRWVHDNFGTNWRMTGMQAAIGLVQLGKLPVWLETRRRNAAILHKVFSRVPALRVTVPPAGIQHAFYRYYTFVRPERLRQGWSRDRILHEMHAAGMPCFTGSCSEIYLEKAFQTRGIQPAARWPVAKLLGETSLAFQVDPSLSENNIQRMADTLSGIMGRAAE